MSSTSPFEPVIKDAFEKGQLSDVVDAFAVSQQRIADYAPVQGPLPKNVATHQMEEVYLRMVSGADFEKSKDQNGHDIIKFSDASYDLTYIMAYMNTEHLHFADKEKEAYENYCKTTSKSKPEIAIDDNGVTKSVFPTEQNFLDAEAEAIDDAGLSLEQGKTLYPDMSYPEKLAINIYTTEYYSDMNEFMQGRKDVSVMSKDQVRDAIVHVAMCGQALNKVPQVNVPGTFRYQGDYDLDKQKKSVESGEAFMTKGFISSATKTQTDFKNTVGITYQDVKGQFVGPLSKYSYECEYIVPPTQVQYSHHVEIETPQQDGTTATEHYFLARPVVDLAGIEKQALAMPYDEAKFKLLASSMISQLPELKKQIANAATPEELSQLSEKIEKTQSLVTQLQGMIEGHGGISEQKFLKTSEKISDSLHEIKLQNQQLLSQATLSNNNTPFVSSMHDAIKQMDEKINQFKKQGNSQKHQAAIQIKHQLQQQAELLSTKKIDLKEFMQNVKDISQQVETGPLAAHSNHFSKAVNGIRKELGLQSKKTATHQVIGNMHSEIISQETKQQSIQQALLDTIQQNKSSNIDKLNENIKQLSTTPLTKAQQKFLENIEHTIKMPLEHATNFLTAAPEVLDEIEQHIEKFRHHDFTAAELKKALEADLSHLQNSGLPCTHLEHFIEIVDKMPLPQESDPLSISPANEIDAAQTAQEDEDSDGEGVHFHQ